MLLSLFVKMPKNAIPSKRFFAHFFGEIALFVYFFKKCMLINMSKRTAQRSLAAGQVGFCLYC